MKKRVSLLLGLLMLAVLCAGSPRALAAAPSPSPAVADASQMTAVEEVVEEGMEPVYAGSLLDGEYPVAVKSSSSMFRIEKAVLRVHGGAMSAVLTMSSRSYLYVYPGSALDAATAEESAYIPGTEDEDGACTFTLPVAALDAPIPCAAFSRNKQLWYDRMLLFRADSLPESAFRGGVLVTAESIGLADGDYTVSVTLGGGSGRASVQSPCRLWIREGKAEAEIVWGSANYDYMKVDGGQIPAEIRDGRSVCVIPVAAFDRALAVIADTTAMSRPHEIEYTLRFDAASIAPAIAELRYADQFTLASDAAGNTLVSVGEERFLLVPAGAQAEAEPGVTVLQVPLDHLYVASSSAMDPLLRLGALDAVRLTGTKREDWTLPELRQRMDEGGILYAGKYAAPDYELLLSEGTRLAVENTMILHSPETKEQLEALGIPVLVERSSYERHPLGRLEWIKLYGLLTGRSAQAAAFFDAQAALAERVFAQESTGKTAAFFSITVSGAVSVRRPEDYIATSIALAGGRYLPALPGDGGAGARSTVNLQAESFYSGARDADVLFYNATIGGGPDSVEELLARADWLADFKAVQSGDVWCTEAELYQQSSGIAVMIDEFRQILSGTADGETLQYFHKLR